MNISLDPKLRNAIAEAVSILGIMIAAIPSIAVDAHVPQWVGAVLALGVTIGNQLVKDSTPPPTANTVAQVEAQTVATPANAVPVTVPVAAPAAPKIVPVPPHLL